MKKLNIAFVWHFHQPNYQRNYTDDFLLPYSRLHASKDYLDMLLRIEKFDNIKLNFNFSPVLLNALEKYLDGAKDLHLKLLLKDKLEKEDKIFILNNYFDLNYKNMVLKSPYFTELFNKRANAKNLDVDIFSDTQYFDIMANYTLLWIDEFFVKDYPILKNLYEKQKGYSLEDRKKIYEIQLDIIKRILVEYKNYQKRGKIEVSTSPYYHPVMPLLLSFQGKEIKNFENLPQKTSFKNDAKLQIEFAKEKYRKIFETQPRGMWLSELCVCNATADILGKFGFKWTILDEGILSKSIKKEFMRDFEGNLENPYNLTINYLKKSKNPINILFADSFFSNLINFGYGNYDSKIAANDLYEKIKIIQSKIQNSPRKSHIVTIALDGENCWETYQNDGAEFLDTLYGLINDDDTLETVLISDYIESNPPEIIENIKGGSWINRNFDLWIGEKTKNLAWLYLKSVSDDLEKYAQKKQKTIKNNKQKQEFEKIYSQAKREILIAQGSDWYWWYGEPNESKNDDIFDYLFRSHLINVYEIIGLEVPKYLFNPLVDIQNRNLRNPLKNITPSLTCDIEDKNKEWKNAGYIFIPDGPSANISSLIKNIYFGKDDKNLYFRFILNRNSTKISRENIQNQIAIYFALDNEKYKSTIRYVNKNDNFYPILKNHFSYEVRFCFNLNYISRLFFNRAIQNNLWCQTLSKDSKVVYKDVIELKIPRQDLNCLDKPVSFCIIDSTNELINDVYAQDVLIEL